jgi:hypothetical protein
MIADGHGTWYGLHSRHGLVLMAVKTPPSSSADIGRTKGDVMGGTPGRGRPHPPLSRSATPGRGAPPEERLQGGPCVAASSGM